MISGTAQVGQNLTTTTGAWSGTTPMSFSYRWRRCNAQGWSCSNIGGATAPSYVLVKADAGRTVRARVTATNALGSTSATSLASVVVQNPPPPPPPPPPPTGDSARFGIACMTHVLSYAPDEEFAQDMGTIDSSGAGWIRMDINWGVIQRDGPTFYDWAPFDRIVIDARARGLNVLGLISWTPAWARPSPGDHYATPPRNTADYANFVWAAVKRYSAMGVHAYEVWNEPNNRGSWKPVADPARYVDLLKAAYLAIKDADPLATVVSGGLSPAVTDGYDMDPREFLQAMYANGAQGYFDALGHHPYSHPAAPGEAQSWSGWYQMYGTSNSLRSTMEANGDGGKKIWGTEFGFATSGPAGSYVSETVQAQHVTTGYALFGSYPWAGPLFLWAERDYGTDPGTNYNFYGLTRKDFSKKPSFTAYQAAAGAG